MRLLHTRAPSFNPTLPYPTLPYPTLPTLEHLRYETPKQLATRYFSAACPLKPFTPYPLSSPFTPYLLPPSPVTIYPLPSALYTPDPLPPSPLNPSTP